MKNKNRATVIVYMPDGCRLAWETLRTAPLATNPKAFAKWLHDTADLIEEGCQEGAITASRRSPDVSSMETPPPLEKK